jgi:cytochrome c oxidase assembly protein subunit 15
MLVRTLAWATVVATLILIVAGGLVTNTGSGLAVPDWPTTFGHNMFLYPWSKMVGGVFYEHSHRLLGSLVGLLTVALAAALWIREPRRWVRLLGLAAVLLVSVQGILGGLRVVLLKDAIATVHGSLAQAFFALTVTLAVVTARAWQSQRACSVAPGLRTTAFAAVALLYTQIVFGALLTHQGRVDLHLVGAVAVLVVVPTLTARARAVGAPLLERSAMALLVLLLAQLGLGVGAYLARFTTVAIPGGPAMALALPVTHRLVAAMILGAAVALLTAVLGAGALPSGLPVRGGTPVATSPAGSGS